MEFTLANPTPAPIVISLPPAIQPADDNKDGHLKNTLIDFRMYKWALIIIAIVLVLLVVAWWFWGRKNNTTNAVRIGGRKGCSA